MLNGAGWSILSRALSLNDHAFLCVSLCLHQRAHCAEPNLHAKLRNIVIDQEVVTRTFPEGTGRIELIATYLVQENRIAKAWFIFGAKTLDVK